MTEAGGETHASEAEPANALRVRGVEHTVRGEFSAAAELFGRAAAMRPSAPASMSTWPKPSATLGMECGRPGAAGSR